jgi:hypothetical protein
MGETHILFFEICDSCLPIAPPEEGNEEWCDDINDCPQVEIERTVMEAIPMQDCGEEHHNRKRGDRQKSCLDAVPFFIQDQPGKEMCACRITRADEQRRGARQNGPGKVYICVIGENIEGDKSQQKYNNDDSSNNLSRNKYTVVFRIHKMHSFCRQL